MNSNYLDPLASWEEKLDDSFGIKIGQTIGSDWFGSGGMIVDGCSYANRRDYIRNKRLTVRGKQNIQSYKDHLKRQDGDLDYLNLEWEMVNWAEKFCRIVSNGIKDEYYNINIKANDSHSVSLRKKRIEEHKKNMRTKPMLEKAKKLLGIDLVPKGFVPKDNEELELWAEMNDRLQIEIAEEVIINYIKDVNKYSNIENIKNKDAVEIGIMAGRCYTDNVEGVKAESIDPEYLVHSFVKKNDFSDCYYYGYIDTITINDVIREANNEGKTFTELQLRQIANNYCSKNSSDLNTSNAPLEKLLGFKVDVLRFSYKTIKESNWKTFKKKGEVVKIRKKDSSFNPPERSDYGKMTDIKDTWLEGTYIIGANEIYGYKEAEKIVRGELNKAKSSFIVRATDIYNNELHSFLDNIEVPAKQLQKIHLKIQHLMAELKPDMTILNEDALADISGTGDKKANWKMALNILNTKNVVIEKNVDMGELGKGTKQGARSVAVQQGSALTPLLNLWAKYYNLIRETTGINPARDGSMPHDALLGVNEMAQMASNTVTKHIVEASIDFNLSFCEVISARVHTIFRNKNAKTLRKMYEKAVGKSLIDAIEILKDRHLHDLGFTAEMLPTSQMLKEFKEDLSLAINDGSIDIEIKVEAERLARINYKLAIRYLIYARKKRRKQRMEEEAKMSQVKSQNDIAANNSASQNQAQLLQMKTQLEIQRESKIVEFEIMKAKALLEMNKPSEEQKFKQDVFMEKLKSATVLNMRKFQEDRKDQRTKIQAGQQSKMIKQRNNNTEPIDFENNFDDIFKNINI